MTGTIFTVGLAFIVGSAAIVVWAILDFRAGDWRDRRER